MRGKQRKKERLLKRSLARLLLFNCVKLWREEADNLSPIDAIWERLAAMTAAVPSGTFRSDLSWARSGRGWPVERGEEGRGGRQAVWILFSV